MQIPLHKLLYDDKDEIIEVFFSVVSYSVCNRTVLVAFLIYILRDKNKYKIIISSLPKRKDED